MKKCINSRVSASSFFSAHFVRNGNWAFLCNSLIINQNQPFSFLSLKNSEQGQSEQAAIE